ncbi:MAG TPA: hypothetical protein ENK13_03560, partial [Thermopetrobacter sp.]|nr:hypothetical protein [Thermopetrobacter sp.]
MNTAATSSANHLYDALMGPHRDSDATFLVTMDGGERRTLSFRDLDRMAARMARALGRLGARPGDRICVQVEKSPE